jgi:hypothetical protein
VPKAHTWAICKLVVKIIFLLVKQCIGVDNLKLLAKQGLVDGFFINKDAELEFCEGSMFGK